MKGNSAVILIVEDDEAHATLIMRAFETAKELTDKIHWVEDGEEALDYLAHRGKYADKEKSPRPDLILLDLRLPKLDGLEVLKEIKNSDGLGAIPVVVLTTSRSETDLIQAYSDHANSYLVKPTNFGEFSEMIRALGFYWLKLNQKPELK